MCLCFLTMPPQGTWGGLDPGDMSPESMKLRRTHLDQYGLCGCAVGYYDWLQRWCSGWVSPMGWSQFSQCAVVVGPRCAGVTGGLSQRVPTESLPGPSGSCGVHVVLPPHTLPRSLRGGASPGVLLAAVLLLLPLWSWLAHLGATPASGARAGQALGDKEIASGVVQPHELGVPWAAALT